MRISGFGGIVAVLVALVAVLQEPAVLALIPEKYLNYVFLATTVLAALTKGVSIEKKDTAAPRPGAGL